MPISISIHLYELPGWELKDIANITPDQLRCVAMDLQSRLYIAADALEKLLSIGWQIDPIGTYDIHLLKSITPIEATRELESIGLLYLIPTITGHK